MANNYLRIFPLDKKSLTRKVMGEPNQIKPGDYSAEFINEVLANSKIFSGYYEVVPEGEAVFKLNKKNKLKSLPNATSRLKVYATREFYFKCIHGGEMAPVYGTFYGEKVKGVMRIKAIEDIEKGKGLEYVLILPSEEDSNDSEQ